MSSHFNKFVWYDLMTTDPQAALAFYSEVIGWRTKPWEGSPEPYTMIAVGDQTIGGVMNLPQQARAMGAPSHWLGYVFVRDVDATTAKAQELGGRIYVPGTDVHGVGRFAVIADPQGAVLGVWMSKSEGGEMPNHEGDGKVSWHELMTTDQGAAWNFYESLFGWKKADAMDMGPDGTYQLFGAGEAPFGGIFNRPAAMQQVPPNWLYYVHVPDLEATIERVKAHGGQVLNGPMDVPGGDHIAQCMDPQGAAFALHARKP